MNLTPSQKQFILDRFFKRLDVTNWLEIANELIEKGQCVVESNKPIWTDGIGKYITMIPNDGVFEAVIYKLDLQGFVGSVWFKQELLDYINQASVDLMKESIRINELTTMLR